MPQDANYRKHNDGSLNSSTYHKKDGTNLRARLKEELLKEADPPTPREDCDCIDCGGDQPGHKSTCEWMKELCEEGPPSDPKQAQGDIGEATRQMEELKQTLHAVSEWSKSPKAQALMALEGEVMACSPEILAACPWLGFSGKAGSREYAKQVVDMLNQDTKDSMVLAVDEDWWYAAPRDPDKEYAVCTCCAPGSPDSPGFSDVCVVKAGLCKDGGWECDGFGQLSRPKSKVISAGRAIRKADYFASKDTIERGYTPVDGTSILAQLGESQKELKPDSPEWKPDYSVTPRRVVCAANRNRKSGRIICGARHWDKVMRAQKRPEESWGGWEQGFIDQFGDFLTRAEAWDVAKEQGQIWREVSSPGRLYSENLY